VSKGITCLALCALLFALCLSAEAQQTGKIYRIGYLDVSSFAAVSPLLEPFRERLRELGWIEGKNVMFEYRFGDGSYIGFSQLATDLAQLKVDVIVTRATEGALAAKHATSIIPIVMASGGDPVGAGIIESLARPGANITGLSTLSPELIAKRLELLREVIPKLTRVGVLGGWNPGGQRQLKELRIAARVLELKLHEIDIKQGPDRYEIAFETAARERVNGIIMTSGATGFANRKRIVELAGKYRLPTVYPQKEYVDEGGLMSYGVSYADVFSRAAVYVDKVLKGIKPADLPVEQPRKFEFVVNLQTAKSLGLTIPPQFLIDADKVIK
jgi:putative ABC transport system substrate-binding protein